MNLTDNEKLNWLKFLVERQRMKMLQKKRMEKNRLQGYMHALEHDTLDEYHTRHGR